MRESGGVVLVGGRIWDTVPVRGGIPCGDVITRAADSADMVAVADTFAHYVRF